MSTESLFMDLPSLVPESETPLCACRIIDVGDISALPVGHSVPISYDDSSTQMIAIFFGFICFLLLSAFIIFLWWPIRDEKIKQHSNNADVESLSGDPPFRKNEGQYDVKIPRPWIETMKRCPDEHFDSRLQQLQNEALDNPFISGHLRSQQEGQNKASCYNKTSAATNGQWSTAFSSSQQSAKQESHEQLARTMAVSEQPAFSNGAGSSRMVQSSTEESKTTERRTDFSGGSRVASMMSTHQLKLGESDAQKTEIKKENFLKISKAYRQYLMSISSQSKA